MILISYKIGLFTKKITDIYFPIKISNLGHTIKNFIRIMNTSHDNVVAVMYSYIFYWEIVRNTEKYVYRNVKTVHVLKITIQHCNDIALAQ